MNAKVRKLMLSKAIAISIFPILATQAGATEILDPFVSASNVVNSSSLRIDGTIFSTATEASAWTVNVFASQGECIRLDLTDQPDDLELVVVSPGGFVYRNDDRAPGDLHPLVKIGTAPVTGWYTVHASRFNGGPTEGNFVLLYGRYAQQSANCADPTPIQLSASFEDENATALKQQMEDSKPPRRSPQPR